MSFASNTAKIVLSAEDRASPAFKAVQNSFAQTLKSADLLRTAVGGIAAGFSVGAVLNYAKGLAQLGAEVDRLAKLSATSVQDFQAQAYAAERAGISSEKYADILKDVQDKVGDFLQTGGGPLKDFFEQIGPRVGVTAEQFRKLGGSDALQLYVSSLEKANLSQSELTFYMEAIASDSALLLPLLRNNGAEMKRLGDEAERLGLVLSRDGVQALKQFDEEMRRLETTASGFGRQVATPIIQEINGIIEKFRQAERESRSAWSVIFLSPEEMEKKNRASGAFGKGLMQDVEIARAELQQLESAAFKLSELDPRMIAARKKLADAMAAQSAAGAGRGFVVPTFPEETPSAPSSGGAKPTKTSASKPASRGAAESPFTGLSYDEQIKQSVGNLLGDSDVVRAKEYADKIKFLDELFFSGAIKADLYDSAVQKLTGSSQKAGEASTEFADRLKELLDATESSQIEKQRKDIELLTVAYQQYLDTGGKQGISQQIYLEAVSARLDLVAEKTQQAKGFAEEFGLSFNSALEDAILNGAKFSDVLQGLAQDIARIAIRKSVTEPLGNALTGWLGSIIPSANGNVFPAGPGISAYSSQVVSKPTIFPFAKGIGLMGEAGAEAIMPLRRDAAGRLGVSAAGASVTVNVINQSGQAVDAQQRSRTGADGQQIIDVVLSAVGDSLANRSGPVSRGLEAGYGIRPAMA